jgi:ADP-ribose pyrophosphatase YjhB (NUDIX family)
MRASEAFRFCPACAAPRATRSGASPLVCEACGFTYYFSAAIATAVFVRRPDGCMLFVRRARDPGKGLLAPPGGFIDVGERAEDALRREIREEVGLEIGPPEFLASFPNTYPYRGLVYPVLDLFFVAEAIDPEQARALDDVDALCWRDPRTGLNPEELAFPSMRSALAVLRAGLACGLEPGAAGIRSS